mgnify:CR=1 FL=1
MTLYDAIYTRQSVDRADSISVESQVEFCKKEVVEREFRVYTDKGYSGKNTDRPAFQRLMGDVEAGLIRRVIIYRLDRISRSVLDFANVVDIFQRHHVDFVSTMEKFDTGTPIGKAMLMIVMIFAQLERETIQQRIADAYASRSRRGFFMGGPAPFGFDLKETVIDGVHTKMFVPNPQEAAIVRQIFPFMPIRRPPSVMSCAIWSRTVCTAGTESCSAAAAFVISSSALPTVGLITGCTNSSEHRAPSSAIRPGTSSVSTAPTFIPAGMPDGKPFPYRDKPLSLPPTRDSSMPKHGSNAVPSA